MIGQQLRPAHRRRRYGGLNPGGPDCREGCPSRLLVVVEAERLDQFLHSGIRIEVGFKVSLYAPDGIIELPHVTDMYFAADDARPPERVEGQPGVITIASPVIGCFFYMH